MMGSSLASLPAELLDVITVDLEFDDLRSLRLTSLTLSTRIADGRLKTFYRRKTVHLTRAHLSKLVENIGSGKLGCLVESLTLVGPLQDAASWRADAEEMLTIAFAQLQRTKPHGRLHAVTLKADSNAIVKWVPWSMATVSGCHGPKSEPDEWQRVWESAQATADVALASLAASGLLIEKLDLLESFPRCSLSYDSILDIANLPGLSPALRGLQSLSLNLSHSMPDDGMFSESQDHTRYKPLAKLLRMCPRLEELTLHWFKFVNT